MKRKPSYFWASTPPVAPAQRLIPRNSQKKLFPSYCVFLQRFFPRANERIASFCSGAALRVASPNSSSLIAFSVI
jgi:hypothetical protein